MAQKKRGRPKREEETHCYDESVASDVRTMVINGLSVDDMAKILNLQKRDVERIYAYELAYGDKIEVCRAYANIRELASNCDNPTVRLNSSKFILERKGGWTEPKFSQELGPDGERINVNMALARGMNDVEKLNRIKHLGQEQMEKMEEYFQSKEGQPNEQFDA